MVFRTLNMDPTTPGTVKFCLDIKVSVRGDDGLLEVDAVRAGDDTINRCLHRATEVGLSRHMMPKDPVSRVIRVGDRCVALDRPPAIFQYYPPRSNRRSSSNSEKIVTR